MTEEYSETVTGKKAVINTLRSLIESRVVCRMGIRRSSQSWITLLLEIQSVENAYRPLIDGVAGFEAVLSKFADREISLEFMNKGGLPCWFNSRVIDCCHPKEILSELPKVLYRTQRRQYFRIEALLGTEITFLAGSSTERKKAKVKNYSAGGVAFFMEKEFNLSVGDSLTDIRLNTLEGKGLMGFHIPKAEVRRVEPEYPYGEKALCAIEFTEKARETRNNIISHVFRQQRLVSRRGSGLDIENMKGRAISGPALLESSQ